MSTEDRVKTILSDELSIHLSEIKLDSRIIHDLGADSIDFIQLSICFEEEFGIEISESELESIQTVSDILELLDSKGIG